MVADVRTKMLPSVGRDVAQLDRAPAYEAGFAEVRILSSRRSLVSTAKSTLRVGYLARGEDSGASSPSDEERQLLITMGCSSVGGAGDC